MSVRRVLITGAAGFVGQHLATALAAADLEVAGLDRPQATAADALPLVRWRRDLGADASDTGRWLADVLAGEGFDAVCHLAGQSSAGASFRDPPGTLAANLGGTLEVLEALRRLQERDRPVPRLLAIGSAEEYGAAARPDRPCREEDPLLPLSPYATSKAAATQLTIQYHRTFGLPTLAARAFNHTGPGQDPRFVFPAFAAQIAAIEAGQQPPLLRTGDVSVARDFLDVRDVVAAYRALLEHGEPGRVYNVCRGSALTIGEGLEILRGLSTVPIEVTTDPSRLRPADVPCLFGDPGALVEATGWRPRRTMNQTLGDLLEAARAAVRPRGETR
jgi:GDP-4-dehydro-6-deoxy-D-mannose reductase